MGTVFFFFFSFFTSPLGGSSMTNTNGFVQDHCPSLKAWWLTSTFTWDFQVFPKWGSEIIAIQPLPAYHLLKLTWIPCKSFELTHCCIAQLIIEILSFCENHTSLIQFYHALDNLITWIEHQDASPKSSRSVSKLANVTARSRFSIDFKCSGRPFFSRIK